MVSRRCVDRKFLLRPGKITNQTMGYVLALAAAQYDIEVHVYCVMSNHLHLVVTDPHARLPAFFQYLDSLAARALNAHYGREGYFWDGREFNAVLLDTPEDIFDRCVYVLANPVADGLVRKARQWPGLWSAPAMVGQEVTFERPTHFFKRDGYLPASKAFKLKVPPGCGTAEEFRERLGAALAAREAEEAAARPFVMGVARILKQRVHAVPRRRERPGQLRPRFAARDPARRRELASRLKEFLAEYGEALFKWREKRREALFPEGTYLMRVLHGVACAGAG